MMNATPAPRSLHSPPPPPSSLSTSFSLRTFYQRIQRCGDVALEKFQVNTVTMTRDQRSVRVPGCSRPVPIASLASVYIKQFTCLRNAIVAAEFVYAHCTAHGGVFWGAHPKPELLAGCGTDVLIGAHPKHVSGGTLIAQTDSAGMPIVDAEFKPVMVRSPPCLKCKSAKHEMKVFMSEFKSKMDKKVELARQYRTSREFYLKEWQNRPEGSGAGAEEMDAGQRSALEVMLLTIVDPLRGAPSRAAQPVPQEPAASQGQETAPAVDATSSSTGLAERPTLTAWNGGVDTLGAETAAGVEVSVVSPPLARAAVAAAPAAGRGAANAAARAPASSAVPPPQQLEIETASAALPLASALASDLCAITVAGHTGSCAEWMGTYAVNAEFSPKNDASVFTAVLNRDHHLYRLPEGTWIFSTSENMRAGRGYGWVSTSKPSASPLNQLWAAFNGECGETDPLLTVAEA